MAEEFQQLPEFLKSISSTLVHHRKSRTAFICGVIVLMAFASSSMLIVDSRITSDTKEITNTPYLMASNRALAVADRGFSKTNGASSKNPIVMNISLNATINLYNNITINDNRHFSNETSSCMELEIQSNETMHNSTYEEKDFTGEPKTCNFRIKRIAYPNITTTNYKLSFDDIRKVPLLTSNIKNHLMKTSRQIDFNSTRHVHIDKDSCEHPEYIVFTWVLCLIALATALKLYYLIKTLLAVVMVAVYTVLILGPYEEIFKENQSDIEE